MGNSVMRPETIPSYERGIPYATALYMIRDAVARRRELGRGKLRDGGLVCALGAFFDDNPKAALPAKIIDEVANYNDSVKGTPKQRQRAVLRWLRWRLRVLAREKK